MREEEEMREAEEERLRAEAAINTIQKRLFDTYKHVNTAATHGDDEDSEDEEEEEGKEQLMDVRGVEDLCYDLGHFVTSDEALASMAGVGDIGHETDHVVALLSFEEFHHWWDRNLHISKNTKLDTPAQMRRWECEADAEG